MSAHARLVEAAESAGLYCFGHPPPSRLQRLRTALLRRIGRDGDMHIRIRGETFRTVLAQCGQAGGLDGMWEDYREIDAMALEALISLGRWP